MPRKTIEICAKTLIHGNYLQIVGSFLSSPAPTWVLFFPMYFSASEKKNDHQREEAMKCLPLPFLGGVEPARNIIMLKYIN